MNILLPHFSLFYLNRVVESTQEKCWDVYKGSAATIQNKDIAKKLVEACGGVSKVGKSNAEIEEELYLKKKTKKKPRNSNNWKPTVF